MLPVKIKGLAEELSILDSGVPGALLQKGAAALLLCGPNTQTSSNLHNKLTGCTNCMRNACAKLNSVVLPKCLEYCDNQGKRMQVWNSRLLIKALAMHRCTLPAKNVDINSELKCSNFASDKVTK